MSELKVYRDPKEGPCWREFYEKSEADKAIANLEESHKMEVEQLLIEIEELKETLKNSRNARKYWRKEYLIEYKECCYQKYKRCLAMANEWRNYASFCGMQSSCHNHRGFGKTAEKYSWKENHAWNCVHRYKELAEQFKEAK